MMHVRGLLMVVVLAVLGGCASQPERESTDPKKAAQFNAELGLNYMVQGKSEQAMQKLLKALEYDDDSVDANHYIAELYRRLGRNDKAAEHFRIAASLAPKDPSIQNNYGVFLCSEKRYDEGIKRMLLALDSPVWPARDEAYENLGQCLRDKGDIDKAEQYFREALALNVNRPRSLLALAEISHQSGNYISARAFLQRYGVVAPHSARSLWLGIQVERLLGDKNAVASYGLALKNNFPNSEEARLYLKSIKP